MESGGKLTANLSKVCIILFLALSVIFVYFIIQAQLDTLQQKISNLNQKNLFMHEVVKKQRAEQNKLSLEFALLNTEITKIKEILPKDPTSGNIWALAEFKQLIAGAKESLLFYKNRDLAVVKLQQADKILSKINTQQKEVAIEALQAKIVELQKINLVDLNLVKNNLWQVYQDSLILSRDFVYSLTHPKEQKIEIIDLAKTIEEKKSVDDKVNDVANTKGGSWKKIFVSSFDGAWQALTKVIKIKTYHDIPPKELHIEAGFIAIQDVCLYLEQAKIAFIMRDSETYYTSLLNAKNRLLQCVLGDKAQIQAIIIKIDALSDPNILFDFGSSTKDFELLEQIK